jgi:hypothetical protein
VIPRCPHDVVWMSFIQCLHLGTGYGCCGSIAPASGCYPRRRMDIALSPGVASNYNSKKARGTSQN